MELDKRILPGKRPLTCFDTEEAKEFLGKECYLSNTYCAFEDLHRIPKAELQYISNDKDASDPYKTACYYYPFCLPCEWVKEPEKKYRPFSLEEFFNIFEVGDLIVFKMKNTDEVKCAMFTGYITDAERIDDKTPGAVELMLGIFHYSLFSLFEDYEIEVNGEWQPFGVIDEDKE